MADILILLIRAYQTLARYATVSGVMGVNIGGCRFMPTCSDYCKEALATHGAVSGLRLSAWRILRCAPWTPAGTDLIPPSHGNTF